MRQTIYSHVFDNGLVLVAEAMPSLESAAFSLRVPAGCVHEPPQRGGLASLTCELALRGCGPRDSRRFVTDLDALGIERGESVTDVHASFGGATVARNLFPALEIYADLVQRAQLPVDELAASRLVSLQELSAVEDEPGQKVMLELRHLYFPDPWGRPSVGQRAELESIEHEEVVNFYQRSYRPDGTILGVAGQFDWDQLRQHVDKLFGRWKPVGTPPPAELPARQGIRHIPHESNQTQIAIAYPSVPYAHPDYFQARGAVGVLSGGMSSRLFTEVREKRGLCYSVFASYQTLREQGCVLCYSGTTAARAQETLDVLLSELDRLAEGIEAIELDRLKARIKSSLIMQQESSTSRSGALAADWYFLGRVRPLDEVARLVDELTPDSINRYLKANPPGRYCIVTLGPHPLEVSVGVS